MFMTLYSTLRFCQSVIVGLITQSEFREIVTVNRAGVNFRRWDAQNSVAGRQFRR